MVRKRIRQKSDLLVNDSTEGERIEDKIERVLNNGEPIEDTAPIIYQPRSEGVRPEFNIRTDRQDLAAEAGDRVTASKLAQRDQYQLKIKDVSKSSGEESIQATE